MITKKSDGSQVKEKESTDSSTTIEDDDVKGKSRATHTSQTLKTMIKFLVWTRRNKKETSTQWSGKLFLVVIAYLTPHREEPFGIIVVMR